MTLAFSAQYLHLQYKFRIAVLYMFLTNTPAICVWIMYIPADKCTRNLCSRRDEENGGFKGSLYTEKCCPHITYHQSPVPIIVRSRYRKIIYIHTQKKNHTNLIREKQTNQSLSKNKNSSLPQSCYLSINLKLL